MAVIDRAPRSQYDALLEAVRAGGGVPAPLAALALTGERFHGNRGRPWVAERGNLHLSCVVPVDLPAAASAAALAAIPAVAVCEAIAGECGDRPPRIKWVNDVLVG
ncbi:hypothetical protein GF314_06710, partial [bacterium]|nr:hypothetical protein [bacterium]